ncbi:ATP-binding protein [Embleya sp. MST-111070]|uniref:ATP-binding protein n=1 Tax=Embleya sp. MST-111070 TaxID=3398231 RepID=UPI003F734A62
MSWFRHGDPSMPAAARRAATALAHRLGFDAVRSEEIGIVVLEAATNLHRHADDGTILLRSVYSGARVAIEVVAVDSGPGISDIAWASTDGNSSRGTLGIGLGGILRLADDADLFSLPGRGVTLALRFRSRAASDAAWDEVAGLTRPISGETVCGDAYAVRVDEGTTTVMLCDGLGHGPMAARASDVAVQAFEAAPPGRPDAYADHLHRAMSGTRGGALSVAQLDAAGGVVRFCGIGNVSGTILSDGPRRGMVSLPGIAGQHARTRRVFEYDLPAGAMVVLHSDGLTERGRAADAPGLTSHTPLVVAATLLRDAGTRSDDACVVAVRAPRKTG